MTETKKNIYEKMTTIKKKLLGLKKSGNNTFSKYEYFELGDILPTLLEALIEENLYMKTWFSASEPIARLCIFEMDNPENKIEFETKVGSCDLKASHDIQNLGAAQTYTRRYLIMMAFDISDGDTIDGGEKPEDKKPQNKKPEEKKPEKKPEPNELENIKRAAWEIIKTLPEDKQAEWQEECKGKNIDQLKKIIQNLDALIAETKQAQITERTELRRLITLAIKSLPEDKQAEWQGVLKGTGEDTEKLKDIKKQLDALIKKPTKPSEPNQGETQAPEKKDGELEIY